MFLCLWGILRVSDAKPFQIVHRFNLPRKTVTDIVDRFICLRSPYTELGKQRRPSIYAMEIQKHLIENQVVEQQRFIESCIDT